MRIDELNKLQIISWLDEKAYLLRQTETLYKERKEKEEKLKGKHNNNYFELFSIKTKTKRRFKKTKIYKNVKKVF